MRSRPATVVRKRDRRLRRQKNATQARRTTQHAEPAAQAAGSNAYRGKRRAERQPFGRTCLLRSAQRERTSSLGSVCPWDFRRPQGRLECCGAKGIQATAHPDGSDSVLAGDGGCKTPVAGARKRPSRRAKTSSARGPVRGTAARSAGGQQLGPKLLPARRSLLRLPGTWRGKAIVGPLRREEGRRPTRSRSNSRSLHARECARTSLAKTRAGAIGSRDSVTPASGVQRLSLPPTSRTADR